MDTVFKAAEALVTFSLIALLLRNYSGTTSLINTGFANYTTFTHGLQSF